MTIAYSTFQNDESFEAKLLLSEQELSQTRSALESSHAERRRLASLLAARNDIIASVQRSIRGFEHPSVADEAVSIKGSRGPETSVVFDPEGNDLYEGYNDEDEDMEEEPVAVPGYQEVSEGNERERKKHSRVSLNFSSSPSPSFLLHNDHPAANSAHPVSVSRYPPRLAASRTLSYAMCLSPTSKSMPFHEVRTRLLLP